MLCPHVTSSAPYEIENVVHPPHENLLNLCHLWAINRSPLMKKLYISVWGGTGRKILVSSRLVPRLESAMNMNEQAHDNMSASHGRCENGKENEKRKWQGSGMSNNTLNINLMYSCCLLHISSANSAAIVKRQSFSKVE